MDAQQERPDEEDQDVPGLSTSRLWGLVLKLKSALLRHEPTPTAISPKKDEKEYFLDEVRRLRERALANLLNSAPRSRYSEEEVTVMLLYVRKEMLTGNPTRTFLRKQAWQGYIDTVVNDQPLTCRKPNGLALKFRRIMTSLRNDPEFKLPEHPLLKSFEFV